MHTSVGIGAAFFTGGASLIVAEVASLMATICGSTGAGLNGTTDVVQTKQFIDQIQSVVSHLQNKCDLLNKALGKYNESLGFMKNFQLPISSVNNDVLAMTNHYYATSSSLKNRVDQTRSAAIFIVFLSMMRTAQCQQPGGTAVLQPIISFTRDLIEPAGMPALQSAFEVVGRKLATTGVATIVLADQAKPITLGITAELTKFAGGQTSVATNVVNSGIVDIAGPITRELTDVATMALTGSVGLIFTFWEIGSLIKNWSVDSHPAASAINDVMTKLEENETLVRHQLQLLVETQAATATRTRQHQRTENPSGDNSDSSDSEDEDEDKVRVFDASAQMLKTILRATGISGIENDDVRSQPESWLVDAIDSLRHRISNSNFGLSSYFLLVDCLHELLTDHNARFRRSTTPSTIVLELPSSSKITFNDEWRSYLRDLLLPIFATFKIPLLVNPSLKSLCCIYRFRCIVCPSSRSCEFNYVGQSRNFKARYKQHTAKVLTEWMDREDRRARGLRGKLYSSVLYEHCNMGHRDVKKFSDVLEVDVVHRLEDHGSNSRNDSRVRRSWEIFNQWLFKAMCTEGGGSRR